MKNGTNTHVSPLGWLLLGLLLVRDKREEKKGETRGEIGKILAPFVDGSERIDGELAALVESGRIKRCRRSSFEIVPAVRREVSAALELPARGAQLTWAQVQRSCLRLLVVGDVSTKPAEPPAPPAPPAPPRPPAAPLPADERAFAERVISAAKAAKTDRYGGNKVFISHVLRQLEREGVAVGDAEAFKARLVSAQRRGFLSLTRADLVEAMDPADVEASLTKYLSTSFHFVRV